MQKIKKLRTFALVGIILVVFFIVPLFARKWTRNFANENSSVIPTDEWKQFLCTAGRFSIWFPGNPELTNVTTSVSGGDISMHCFFVWNRQTEYAVNFSEDPINLKKFKPEQTFDICQAGVAKELGKIVYQKDMTIEGYPARDFEYNVVGKVNYSGRTRLILVNDHLYQLVFIFLPVNPRPTDRDTFFDSFRLQN